MAGWEDLDAKYGATGGNAPSWDDIDKRFTAYLAKQPAVPQKAEPVDFSGGTLQFGTFDTGIQLPASVNKRLAQFGSGVADWTTRLGQLNGTVSQQDVAEKRGLDAQLRDDTLGKVLGFGGKVAPSFAIPFSAGAPILSGALGGAASGFMEPVGPGESTLANTALGAGLGAAIPAAVKGARYALKPGAETAADIAKANQYGIPLAPADTSKVSAVKAVRSFLNDLPISSIPGNSLKDAQQQALNKAVGATFGTAETKLTPQVMDAAKKRMGAEFDRLWGRNNLDVDAQLFRGMQQLEKLADDMPKSQAAAFRAKIADFWSKAQPGQNGVSVSGDAANNFQQYLRQQADGAQGYMKDALSGMRRQIIDAFNRSIGPQEAAALTANRSQYKAFKTVEPLLDKGAAGSAGRVEGDIPAALLSEAVRKSYPGLAINTNKPALAEISSIAGKYLVDRVPQTGGSMRGALQGWVGGALGLTGLPANVALNSPRLAAAVNAAPTKRGLLDMSSLEMLKDAGLLSLQRSPLGIPLMYQSATTE